MQSITNFFKFCTQFEQITGVPERKKNALLLEKLSQNEYKKWSKKKTEELKKKKELKKEGKVKKREEKAGESEHTEESESTEEIQTNSKKKKVCKKNLLKALFSLKSK